MPDYLEEVLGACAEDDGELADYIPELASADPDRLAVALTTLDGETYAAGDADERFTVQSISKPFVYALALADRGLDAVLEAVGTEPSGDPFNEISLEDHSGRPRNPMINIGAITTHSLVGTPGCTVEERFERVRSGLSAFAGRELEVDERVFASERAHADRNLALAYMVSSRGIISEDPAVLVQEYTRQCSVVVDVRDLSAMAATLANGGLNPATGVRVLEPWVCRQVLAVMATCGMYDAAGDWLSSVGIPAKSGVAGGIMGALPGQVGLATFSPRLDGFGNSSRGVRICERLSRDMGLHLMSLPATGPSVLRGTGDLVAGDGDGTARAVLQGAITFAGAERVLRELATIEPGDTLVVLDLSRVSHVDDVGRRMVLEGIRRLSLDGHPITLVDPERTLPDPDAGDGVRPEVVDRLADDAPSDPGHTRTRPDS
ncbi:glutaminase A [Aeromicrobium marinum DSM 15272]|uniref:Glutaminase n=1 Tax=Aeromicrobium marinum DSM 15272 TaxID=585531 RepID=E2SEZ3_9ACTN|nr:glutaminase A [Aeromicrobium marinum DSM 15272]